MSVKKTTTDEEKAKATPAALAAARARAVRAGYALRDAQWRLRQLDPNAPELRSEFMGMMLALYDGVPRGTVSARDLGYAFTRAVKAAITARVPFELDDFVVLEHRRG